MESLIMDKHITFAPDFKFNHVSNTASSSSSSSSIGEEDHDDESFDDDDEVNSLTSPLQDPSCLLQHLPFKRGLSKHYSGKSQSFTSLLSVASLEDLAKPENPLNKKLKTCKSYAVFPTRASSNNVSSPGFASVVGATKAPLSYSTNNSCNNNKPPI